MTFLLMAASMVGVSAGIAGWLWLCAGLRRDGWRGVAGRLAVQVSGLCLAYGLLSGQPMPGLFMALFPPLAIVYLKGVVWGAVPWALVALGGCLAVPALRRWWLGLAGIVALVAAMVTST